MWYNDFNTFLGKNIQSQWMALPVELKEWCDWRTKGWALVCIDEHNFLIWRRRWFRSLVRENRLDCLKSKEANLTHLLVCGSFLRWGLSLLVRTLSVRIMHTNTITLLGGDLSMTFKLSCPSNKSSYFLWIMLYAEHVRSKWYSILHYVSIAYLAYLHTWVLLPWCYLGA